MNDIIIVLLAILKIIKLFGGLFLIVVPILLEIQLISYQVFHFNIYKKICKFLFN